MSEVDRLSNSGLYPALPIADRRGSGKESANGSPDGRSPLGGDGNAGLGGGKSGSGGGGGATGTGENSPRPPKSIIDEYA